MDDADDERTWDEDDDWPPAGDSRRRRWIRRIAWVAAVAVATIPFWNVIGGSTARYADNGLEVCTFDYCVVEEAVDEAGHRITMARLSEERLDDRQAQDFADRLREVVDGPPVTVEVVDNLPGDIGGRYLGEERVIEVRRPATRWIVIHEVAHSVGAGHGSDFEDALITLVEWVSERTFS